MIKKTVLTMLMATSLAWGVDASKADTVEYINKNAEFIDSYRSQYSKVSIKVQEDGSFTFVGKDTSDGRIMERYVNPLGAIMGTFTEQFSCKDIQRIYPNGDRGFVVKISNNAKYVFAEPNAKQANRIKNAIHHLCMLNGVDVAMGDPGAAFD